MITSSEFLVNTDLSKIDNIEDIIMQYCNDLTIEVKDLADFQPEGNIIPHEWYCRLKYENGKPDINAIIILSEILYWYRPTTIRDELSGRVTGYKKKFKSDLLQKSYQNLEELFGLSTKQIREAIIRLEEKQLILRVFKTINSEKGRIPNIMFIKIFPQNIIRLSEQIIDSNMISPSSIQEKDNLGTNFTLATNSKKVRNSNKIENLKIVSLNQENREGVSFEGTISFPQSKGGVSLEGKTYTENNYTNNNSLLSENDIIAQDELLLTEKMLNIWNQTIRKNSTKLHLTEERRKRLTKIIKHYFGNCEDNWTIFCEKITTSKFLMGQVTEFKISIDWLLNEKNLIRVLEGEYGIQTLGFKNKQEDKKEKSYEEEYEGNLLRKKLSEIFGIEIYKAWFKKIEIEHKLNNILFSTNNKFVASYVQDNFADKINTIIKNIYGDSTKLEIIHTC